MYSQILVRQVTEIYVLVWINA